MDPFFVFLIVIGILHALFCIVLFGVIFPVKAVSKKYTNYNKKNSRAVHALEELNAKYKFREIPKFSYKNTYDNETHFKNVSCVDYLTYQLAYFDGKRVSKFIEDIKYNQFMYNEYLKEKEKIDCFSQWDSLMTSPKNVVRLSKYEHKLFNSLKQKPQLTMSIDITIRRTNIQGTYITKKIHTASLSEIEFLLKSISNKRGDRYLDEEIWNSLVRVERGKVSNKMRFYIFKRDGYRCKMCGRRYNVNNLEIDHIYPIAKGGRSNKDNLQTLCHKCNVKKGDSVL